MRRHFVIPVHVTIDDSRAELPAGAELSTSAIKEYLQRALVLDINPDVTSVGLISVTVKPEDMTAAHPGHINLDDYFWPTAPGSYVVWHRRGGPQRWQFDGHTWQPAAAGCAPLRYTTEDMLALNMRGVRRSAPEAQGVDA